MAIHVQHCGSQEYGKVIGRFSHTALCLNAVMVQVTSANAADAFEAA